MKGNPIHILICDDHQLLIDGIRMMLEGESDLQYIGHALNGQEALDMIEFHTVDIALMDINMPVLNGIEATKIICKRFPDTAVIGLSMLNDLEMIRLMANSGAKGYLLKNSPREEVIKAIRVVASGEKYFDQKVFLNNAFTVRKPINSMFPKLTKREKQVLGLIINEYTSQEIADKLFIGLGTVDTHRRNMISKLGVKNTAGLVRVAVEYNLVS